MPMLTWSRSSHPEVFLRKGVLKVCSKFTGEHPCRSAISIKLESNFIEITLRHGCSPVNLLHISNTPFLKNTSGRLYLLIKCDPNTVMSTPAFFNTVMPHLEMVDTVMHLWDLTKLIKRFWSF